MTQELSTEVRSYRLIARDGAIQKRLRLTDEEAERYIAAKEAGKQTFFLNGNEYPMRDCLLKKITKCTS